MTTFRKKCGFRSGLFTGVTSGALWLCGVLGSPADTLLLQNGRELEGVVLNETDTLITFKQGAGNMVLPRSSVQTVRHDPPEVNRERLASWRARYFYLDEYAPPEFAPLAARFRELQTARDAARRARQTDLSESNDRALRDRQKELIRQQTEMLRQLKAMAPEVRQKVDERNQLIAQINELSVAINRNRDPHEARDLLDQQTALRRRWKEIAEPAERSSADYHDLLNRHHETSLELTRIADRLEQMHDRRSLAQSLLLPYAESIDAVRKLLAENGTPENRARYPFFFEGLDTELAEAAAGLKTETIPFTQQGNSLLVNVRLNNALDVVMILDTGASSMTISKALATRLGILLDAEFAGRVILADGSSASASAAVLDSVQVGSSEQRDVPVIILDRAPGPGVDGLLGMSFLKNFIVKVQASGNQVQLIGIPDDSAAGAPP
jgi:clan AA aspartic protease (TIGR02281 family)